MQRSQPNLRSDASPRICALECQKTLLPSGCSNGRSSSLQLFSSGRSRSHSVSSGVPLSRRAMTVRSNRLLLIFRAISAGLVTQDWPAIVLPSSSVIVMSSMRHHFCQYVTLECQSGNCTARLLGDFLVVLGLKLLTGGQSVFEGAYDCFKLTRFGFCGQCTLARGPA